MLYGSDLIFVDSWQVPANNHRAVRDLLITAMARRAIGGVILNTPGRTITLYEDDCRFLYDVARLAEEHTNDRCCFERCYSRAVDHFTRGAGLDKSCILHLLFGDQMSWNRLAIAATQVETGWLNRG